MSEASTKNRSAFQFRLPPTESLIALGSMAALLGIAAVYFENYHAIPTFILIVLFAAAIWKRWTWTVYLLSLIHI